MPRPKIRTAGIAALGLLVVLVAGALVLRATLLAPHLPAAEQGRRLAEATGCFTCHGPGGTGGTSNPGRRVSEVPNFGGDLMMYAEDPETIREWIRDGVPAARAESRSWLAERDAGILVMPAFGDRFSDPELDQLVAFVQAVGGATTPGDSLARAGLQRGRDLGCFGCHGPGGRFAPPNPGSLKGYIASWDEADFPELVRDRAEFEEWVTRGISNRFEENRLASFFLERAAIQMPAYEDHLEPGDLDALWAYIRWLREPEP